MVPVRPESARVRRSLADSAGQSAGLCRTLAGLRGPVQSIGYYPDPIGSPRPPKKAPAAPATVSKPSRAPIGAMFTHVYYSCPSLLASGSKPAVPKRLLGALGKLPISKVSLSEDMGSMVS